MFFLVDQLLIILGGSLMLAILKTFSDNLVGRPAEVESFHFENVIFFLKNKGIRAKLLKKS